VKIECLYCGEKQDFLIKMPVTVIKATENERATFSREGYKADRSFDSICFDCLKFEAEEAL
jgi:hypothetical protein